MSTLTENPRLTNIFGPLKPELRARLKAVLDDPASNWEDAYCIIVNGSKTLWQYVIAVDPTFPKTGPVTDAKGRTVKSWDRYPDQLTIAKALRYAANGR